MTLAQELAGLAPSMRLREYARRVELEDPPFKLPFDGQLSADELRMAEIPLERAEWEA